MKKTLNAVLAMTAGTLMASPALAHDPKAVEGGWSAMVMHQLTQTDHIAAIVAAFVLGVVIYVSKRAKAQRKPD